MSERKSKLEAFADQYGNQFNDVPQITVQQLQDMLAASSQQVVLVDTRSKEETEVSMIPGSTLTAAAFEQQRQHFRDYKIVCYWALHDWRNSTAGYRSAKYAQQLRAQSLDAVNLRGSILAWTQAGLPLEDARKQPTKRVHVYGPQWELQGDGYQAIKFKRPLLRGLMDLARSLLP